MPATQRYCAFLRAINVGGHTIKMDQLRALVEQLGYTNVATYIASGNVMFDAPDDDAPALEAQIERHLHAALGYEVTTFLRTAGELAAVAAYTPFPAETGSVAWPVCLVPEGAARRRGAAARAGAGQRHRRVPHARPRAILALPRAPQRLAAVLGYPAA
ncbi:MAG: DUF1697 domain-containing protein [Kouleothrix sp.]|nr:DUF1697 domain-containing protein [Kouleothrix sp.]